MRKFGVLFPRVDIIAYLISVFCTILSVILSIIDKEEADIYNIIDIILGILLILVLTFAISLLKKRAEKCYFYIAVLTWIANNILGFLTYKNEKSEDYHGVCVFLRIVRILSVLSCLMLSFHRIDD